MQFFVQVYNHPYLLIFYDIYAAQDQHCSDQRGTVAVTASQSLVGCVSEGHSANQNARNEGSQAVENAGECGLTNIFSTYAMNSFDRYMYDTI